MLGTFKLQLYPYLVYALEVADAMKFGQIGTQIRFKASHSEYRINSRICIFYFVILLFESNVYVHTRIYSRCCTEFRFTFCLV